MRSALPRQKHHLHVVDMIYRRPKTFDESEKFLHLLESAKVDGDQAQFVCALRNLREMDWFRGALQPLYEANAVVQLVTHSLVPIIQELVLEKDALEDMKKSVSPAKNSTRRAEFQSLRVMLQKACVKASEREVTPRFARMRTVMQAYAHDDEVDKTLSLAFVVSKPARIALRLMTQRIVQSLEKDSDITSSSDLPLEALSL